MSATATQQQPPVVPPRPSRGQDVPKVPPRPVNRRLERSVSPNPDRFAPSPLNESLLASKSLKGLRFTSQNGELYPPESIDRSASVEMPSLGEEGMEYAAVADELSSSPRDQSGTSPEHTRTVGEDLELHEPKPSLPALSAKERVAAVTRTDSDRAASFGIGRPSSEEPAASNRSLKKKASTTSQLSSTSESHLSDEQGIPEIGQQVPMYPNAGDVQAPSPAPNSMPGVAEKKHHYRKTSSRGFAELPPGSYGLHGHGTLSTDKLEKAYYVKHPELAQKEHSVYQPDRPTNFSMSSEALNKIVRETASHGTGLGTQNIAGTPSEQVGWQAIEESASRISSPRPTSTGPKPEIQSASALKKSFDPEIPLPGEKLADAATIHVDEPGRRKSVMFSDEETPGSETDEPEIAYQAPILAADEVAKDPTPVDYQPAVEPPPERRGSAFEMEEPQSRPRSRPASIHKEPIFEVRSTPLDDVDEYEPLFQDDGKKPAQEVTPPKPTEEFKQRFPSRDIWEDAPNSVHFTAEVSTPEIPEQHEEEQRPILDIPQREGETPAQAFARHQEELAEAESRTPDGLLRRQQQQKPIPTWAQHQPHIAKEIESASRPSARRFPSRDVWEDVPDSLQLETTVSTPQLENEEASPSDATAAAKPEIPQRPAAKKAAEPSSAAAADKPANPERPRPKQTPPAEEAGSTVTKPAIPERPKPQVPARPAAKPHLPGSDKEGEAAGAASIPRTKPAVPARPMGSKIAALQAGFMSDLNRRLQLGPQAPKKEEPAAAEEPAEEKEKVPLSDARKGRARGPQRRAPAAAAAAATSTEKPSASSPLSFSVVTTTVYSIDPEEDVLTVHATDVDAPAPAPAGEQKEAAKEEPKEAEEETKEAAAAPESAPEPAPAPEAPTEEKVETLATNTAGETIVEAKVEETGGDEQRDVEPTEVAEVAKE